MAVYRKYIEVTERQNYMVGFIIFQICCTILTNEKNKPKPKSNTMMHTFICNDIELQYGRDYGKTYCI